MQWVPLHQLQERFPLIWQQQRVCIPDQTEAAKRESGEYLIPLKEGLIKEDHIVGSIGEVLLGKAPGRTADDEITIFDALGLAIEDVASAKYVYERAAL